MQRRRLTDEDLEREATYLVEEKKQRVLVLVYASDPQMQVDAMCRHVELLRRVLERHGGRLVGSSAESLEESDYRRLVNAGCAGRWSGRRHTIEIEMRSFIPAGRRSQTSEYRLNAYERMLAAGVEHVGIGVLSGFPIGDATGRC